MQIRFVFALMLGLLYFNVPMSKAQPEASKVVFQKELPDKRKLVVVRKEVPYKPSPPVYSGTGKSRVHLTELKPDRTGEFSLFLVSNHGDARRLLWKKTIHEYIKYKPETKIFDVFFEKNTLVVVYNVGDIYQAELVTPPSLDDKKVMTLNLIFYRRARDEDPSVAAVTVQRWGRNKILSLAVRLQDGETGRFLWTPNAKAGESKWVRIKRPLVIKPPIPENESTEAYISRQLQREPGPFER